MENTKDAINTVIQKINLVPYIFSTEADIQGLIYSELLSEYKSEYSFDYKNHIYHTNLVHREYFEGGTGGRIDIVVFDKDDVKNIGTSFLCVKTSEKPYYRPVYLQDAIEVKIICGKGLTVLENQIKNDLSRLARLKNSNKAKNVHFVLVLRSNTDRSDKKEGFDKIVDETRLKCESDSIMFYCNEYKSLFSNLTMHY